MWTKTLKCDHSNGNYSDNLSVLLSHGAVHIVVIRHQTFSLGLSVLGLTVPSVLSMAQGPQGLNLRAIHNISGTDFPNTDLPAGANMYLFSNLEFSEK